MFWHGRTVAAGTHCGLWVQVSATTVVSSLTETTEPCQGTFLPTLGPRKSLTFVAAAPPAAALPLDADFAASAPTAREVARMILDNMVPCNYLGSERGLGRKRGRRRWGGKGDQCDGISAW